MTWLDFKLRLMKPLIERNLAQGLLSRFSVRSLLDIVRKREEFQHRLHEVSKRSDARSVALAEKYQHYLDTLDWILHAHL